MALTATSAAVVGNYAPDFELPGVDNSVHHLAQYLSNYKLVCVVFLSNTCPKVRSHLPHLQSLQDDFPEIKVIGINSNDSCQDPQESFEQMQQFAQQWHLNFPYLRDSTQDVALGFQAQVTPEVFLIDRRGLVRYRGGLDGLGGETGTIALLLTTTDVLLSSNEAIGSPISWR